MFITEVHSFKLGVCFRPNAHAVHIPFSILANGTRRLEETSKLNSGNAPQTTEKHAECTHGCCSILREKGAEMECLGREGDSVLNLRTKTVRGARALARFGQLRKFQFF